MSNTRSILSTAVAAVSILVTGQAAAAQTDLIAPTPDQGIWFEATRPHFKSLDVTIPTSIWHASGRLRVNEQLRAVVAVPFAYVGFDDDAFFGDETNSVLGNPYLGLEYRAVPGLTVELGARAPLTTADENSTADVIGVLGEPQRGEAFMQDAVPVTAALMFERSVAADFSLRARGGVTAAFYTGDDDEEETSTFADYGLFGTYDAGTARIGAGFSGRWLASADEGSFSDNSIHQATFTIDAPFGAIRPGLSLSVPLDKSHREVMDYSIGAYLQLPLP